MYTICIYEQQNKIQKKKLLKISSIPKKRKEKHNKYVYMLNT